MLVALQSGVFLLGTDEPRLLVKPVEHASGLRFFATPHPGFPDGSCVDAEGCLWNAEWGAARVVRYTPVGKIDRVIEVPAKNPTCCCFGGAILDTLYITSAGAGLSAITPGVKGLAESRFG